MDNILERFEEQLDCGKITYKTFSLFLENYNDAYLYIKQNYDLIIHNIVLSQFCFVVDIMYDNVYLRRTIEDHFLTTIQSCGNSANLQDVLSIYLDTKSDAQKRDFLKPYFSFLVETLRIDELIFLLKYKDLDKKFYEELNVKIMGNKEEYIKGILSLKEVCGRKIYKDIDSLVDIVVSLIEELFKEEEIVNGYHLNYVDIHLYGGEYSIVFQIGDKMLNIGDRESYEIPNHRRLLQSLIRVDISSLVSEDIRVPRCIDVSERVDIDSKISEEELYTVYKELRDDNILWTDVKVDNVGRLIKPNKRFFSKSLAHVSRALGFTRELDNNLEILDVGEVVVMDKDFIYDLNYFNIQDVDYWSELATFFEKKYQLEKESNQDKKL